jgi:hypothetical protein
MNADGTCTREDVHMLDNRHSCEGTRLSTGSLDVHVLKWLSAQPSKQCIGSEERLAIQACLTQGLARLAQSKWQLRGNQEYGRN